MAKRTIKPVIKKKLPKKREPIFDVLRAIAVLLMIFTHVIAIAYDHKETSSRVVYYLGLLGGLATFTIFFFISGASTYFSLFSIPEDEAVERKKRKRKIVVRSIQIILVYYILAFTALIISKSIFLGDFSLVWVRDFFKVILFLRVIEFTEFLIPFAAFSVTTVLLYPLYKFLLQNKLLLLLAGVASYSLGSIFYFIEFENAKLSIIKAWFAGNADLHTFPLFQYAPVFLLGLLVGNIYYLKQHHVERNKIILRVLLSSVVVAVLSIGVYIAKPVQIFNPSVYDGRFPPSVSFLVLGISGVLLITILLQTSIDTEKHVPHWLQKLYLFSSRHALSLLFFHTLIIYILEYSRLYSTFSVHQKYSHLHEILAVFVIVLLLSYISTYASQKIISVIIALLRRKTLVSSFVQYIIIAFLLSILGGFVFGDVFDANFKNGHQIDAASLERVIPINTNPLQWYDYSFNYRRAVAMNRDVLEKMYENSGWGVIRINHEEYKRTERSTTDDATDITLVKVDLQENKYELIPIYRENANTNDLRIYFKETQVNYDPNQKLYIYYGNSTNITLNTENTPISDEAKANVLSVDLLDEEIPNISLQSTRTWHLIRKDSVDTLEISGSIKSSLPNQVITYEIPELEVSGELTTAEGGGFAHSIDLSDFEPGTYSIQVSYLDFANGIDLYSSNKIPFIISYPLYYAFTIDWEGWGVAQYDLDEMSRVSNDFGAPMTHFFNPRIYVKNQFSTYTINTATANYMASWVKTRRDANGDEIALHLHMYTDMLQEIGIEGTVCETKPEESTIDQNVPPVSEVTPPKNCTVIEKKPRVIGVGTERDEGLIHMYSEEEFSQVLDWAINIFIENGLGMPVSFRSGAWMSGPHILSALEDAGIKLDSSGRTAGILDPNYQYSSVITWNLSPTVYPYNPNVNDINLWNDPSMQLWEFPNNGADTYWFTGDDLKSRFDTNYQEKGKPLKRPQAITMLSHAQGFSTYDAQEARSILQYASQFAFTNDKGPVIFSTLEDIYYQWDTTFADGN